ncbi:MAG: lipoyl synthase [Deltaproteobacteria bacterium]|nr:lipoyl synthase [Deltaproteobacteria bacterium]
MNSKDYVSLVTRIIRKPEWLKVKLPHSKEFNRVKRVLKSYNLHSVCQEALCPNITECFHSGTATFLVLGDICTRNCRYCNITSGIPRPIDEEEPKHLTDAVKKLGLQYIVITSVTRDDLSDGGAEIFARCVELLHEHITDCRVEVLIPDLHGNWDALDSIIAAGPDVINHNMETVKPLFESIRPQGDYRISLELLRRIKDRKKTVVTKSGFMIGLGEEWNDILALMKDLADVECDRLTIGQYQQPTLNHWPVHKYYHPGEFDDLKQIAEQMGFQSVEAGPLVRSSYHAARMA